MNLLNYYSNNQDIKFDIKRFNDLININFTTLQSESTPGIIFKNIVITKGKYILNYKNLKLNNKESKPFIYIENIKKNESLDRIYLKNENDSIEVNLNNSIINLGILISNPIFNINNKQNTELSLENISFFKVDNTNYLDEINEIKKSINELKISKNLDFCDSDLILYPNLNIIPSNINIIKQSDFSLENPIYNIKNPGIYKLNEDIILDFHNFNKVLPPPFHFGIFCGISIQTDNVVLDLNNFSIKMSEKFALNQRFFSIIELANIPFLTGKAGFTNKFIPANNIIIKNGTLGRSSHHGIHGNNNSKILIKNIIIEDFEVAGIALNSCKNLIIEHCILDNSNLIINVNHKFALLKDLFNSLKKITKQNNISENDKKIANNYINDENLNHILKNPGNDKFNYTKRKCKKPEGNLYGIYISHSFNIHDFPKTTDNINYSKNILIKDVKIKNINNGPSEIISIYCKNYNDRDFQEPNMKCKLLTDLNGYLINWNSIYDNNGKSLDINNLDYKVSKIQLWTSQILKKNIPINIFNDIINDNLKSYQFYDFCPFFGVDNRGHLNKGLFGIRFDGVQNFKFSNINIDNVKSIDDLGLTINLNYKSNYSSLPNVWHDSKKIYKGNYTFGISLIKSKYADIDNCSITNLNSENGSTIGISNMQSSNNIKYENIEIQNLFSDNYDNKINIPNIFSKSIGFLDDNTSNNIIFDKVNIKNLKSLSDNINFYIS